MAGQDWKKMFEDAVAERRLINERIARAYDYDKALNRLELSPNGDDYNALIEIIGDGKVRLPTAKGR